MTREEQNRERKCRKIVAFMIGELHRIVAAVPTVAPDAARGAGYNSISDQSEKRVIAMLGELAERLSRERTTDGPAAPGDIDA